MNPERSTVRRICLLAGVMGVAALLGLWFLPHRAAALRPAGWWMVPVIAVAYGIAERTVFHFEFRKEAISFSISEVPTVFALLYLAPGPAVAARLVGSLAIIAIQWRSPSYKLFFNASLFMLELAIAYHIVQPVLDRWGNGPTVLLFTLALAASVSFIIGSIFVSVAISLVEGGLLERMTEELSLSVWVAPLNGLVAAAMVAPTMLSPWLVALAAVPLIAFWAIMHGYGRLDQRYRDLDALHGFVRKVGPSLDLDELTGIAISEAALRLRAHRGAIVVFEDNGGVRRHDVGEPLPQLPTSADDPRWRDVLRGANARRVGPTEAAVWGLSDLAEIGEVVATPITDGRTPLGIIALAGREGAEFKFRAGDLGRLATMADQLAPSLRKSMFHERIEFEARHDALTSLPNRSSFERLIENAIAVRTIEMNDEDIIDMVLMMDLDRFKEVNDTLGHHAGDGLLVAFSERLAAILEPGDVLARLAGDEFAVLARRTVDGMHQLALRLVNEARRPFSIDGLEVVVTMSVGVAPMVGDVKDASTMLRRADIAMYAAKNQHTGYELYRDEIDRRTPARLAMLGDLRNALEQHDLTVHLQPKLDLATGMVVGMEALARWAHPTRGFVSPEDFVPVAEETGLIKQLTDLVLESSIQQVAMLKQHGHHLGLAVNLSTHDLLDELLADRVLRRLEQYDVDPSMLTLEITESSLLLDAPRSRATIDRLNDAGIRLSVDDFGTGYSSLSYLRRLPVSELKIDRSFVSNLLLEDQDEVIVRSIIDLGHNLGMQVVAEGVETDEILSRLRGFGCDVAQGYGICRPIPYDQFLTWLGTTQHPSRRQDPLRPGAWLDDTL